MLSAVTATEARHVISGNAFAQYFIGQGTFLIEFTPVALQLNQVFWGIGQAGNFDNSIYLVHDGSGQLWLTIISSGALQWATTLGAIAAGTRCKVAISIRADGQIAARANGGAEYAYNVTMPAVINTESLLAAPWSGGSNMHAHMHVRKYKPVPSRGDLYQLTV